MRALYHCSLLLRVPSAFLPFSFLSFLSYNLISPLFCLPTSTVLLSADPLPTPPTSSPLFQYNPSPLSPPPPPLPQLPASPECSSDVVGSSTLQFQGSLPLLTGWEANQALCTLLPSPPRPPCPPSYSLFVSRFPLPAPLTPLPLSRCIRARSQEAYNDYFWGLRGLDAGSLVGARLRGSC